MGHRNKRITQYRLFLLSIKIPCRYCAGAGVDIIVNDVNDYIVDDDGKVIRCIYRLNISYLRLIYSIAHLNGTYPLYFKLLRDTSYSNSST
jgi:hypothetical protein